MTQRVRRVERLKRSRGFVYRGAHVYRWVDHVRESLAAAREAIALPQPNAFVSAMDCEIYGLRVSDARFFSFELGCYDLLEDVLSMAPPEPPMQGLRAWVPEREVSNG